MAKQILAACCPLCGWRHKMERFTAGPWPFGVIARWSSGLGKGRGFRNVVRNIEETGDEGSRKLLAILVREMLERLEAAKATLEQLLSRLTASRFSLTGPSALVRVASSPESLRLEVATSRSTRLVAPSAFKLVSRSVYEPAPRPPTP